jgi:hypothetical protein
MDHLCLTNPYFCIDCDSFACDICIKQLHQCHMTCKMMDYCQYIESLKKVNQLYLSLMRHKVQKVAFYEHSISTVTSGSLLNELVRKKYKFLNKHILLLQKTSNSVTQIVKTFLKEKVFKPFYKLNAIISNKHIIEAFKEQFNKCFYASLRVGYGPIAVLIKNLILERNIVFIDESINLNS